MKYSIKFFVTVFTSILLMGSLPASSDYENLMPNIFSFDPIADGLREMNANLCDFSKVHPHLNVDKGPYLARVDVDSCFRGFEQSEDFWADILIDVKSIPGNSKGYTIKAWTTIPEGDIYFIANMTSPPDANNINGDYSIYSCLMSTLSTTDCTRKELMISSNKLVEFYQSTIESADATHGQIKLFKALINSKESGYGAFYTYNVDPDGSNPDVIREFESQYSFSGNRASINISISSDSKNTPNYAVGSSCVSTKASDADKMVYEYNLYDSNGKLVTLESPGFGFLVVDSTGAPILSSANNNSYINGRVSAGSNSYSIDPADETYINQQLSNSKKLYAKSWYSRDNNLYPIVVNGNTFTIIDGRNNGNSAYIASAPITFSLNTNTDASLLYSKDPLPNSRNINFEYQGSGYIGTDFYPINIIDGAQITTTSASPSIGTTYYVRPSLYQMSPKVISGSLCNPTDLTSANLYKNDLINVQATFTDFGNKRSL